MTLPSFEATNGDAGKGNAATRGRCLGISISTSPRLRVSVSPRLPFSVNKNG